MKTLSILFILIFSLLVSAQTKTIKQTKSKTEDKTPTCDVLIQTRRDRMTNKVSSTGRRKIIATTDRKTGIVLKTFRSSGIWLSFTAVSSVSNCISEKSKVIFLFTDKTTRQTNFASDFNCDGEAFISFGYPYNYNDAILEDLITKKVQAIRVYMMKSVVEEDFIDVEATELQSQLKCLNELSN
jgi:hypothetical protein